MELQLVLDALAETTKVGNHSGKPKVDVDAVELIDQLISDSGISLTDLATWEDTRKELKEEIKDEIITEYEKENQNV